MGKRTLTERFVQNSVAERLNKEYYRRKPAYVATEEYTRLKRADVFLAFMRARNRPYVVVVEAKSRTTIHQLKLREAPQRVRWAGRAVAGALIVVLMLTLGYQWYFNALNTIALLGVFLAASTLISRLLRQLDLRLLSNVSVIEQLGRYPANEKWIAVGEDTFAKPEQYDILYEQCKKNGLGLIVVTEKGKVQRKLIPSPRHVFNNYLGSYGKETKILKAIDRDPDYGPTPPERAKKRRQLLNAASLLALVGLLALLTYEEQVRPVVPDPFADDYVATAEAEAAEPVEEAPQSPQGEAPQPPKGELNEENANGEDAGAESGGGAEPVPDCAAFVVEERAFLLVDALLAPANARARLAELNAAGLTGFRLVPTECLNSWPAPGRVAVYRDTLYASRPAAGKAARAHRRAVLEAGLPFKYGRGVKVRP